MKKERLIAINFDLDTKKLKDVYVSSTGKKYNRAYYDIKAFMKKNGFLHRQGSGYISKEPMTEMAAAFEIKKMGNLMPWLKDCTRRIDLTVVGNQFDLTEVLNTKSNNNLTQNKNSLEKTSIKTNTNNAPKEETVSVPKQQYENLKKDIEHLSGVIDTTNLILNEHPELKEAFKKAKAETLQRKAEKEKGGLNDKKSENKISEHKKKSSKPKL